MATRKTAATATDNTAQENELLKQQLKEMQEQISKLMALQQTTQEPTVVKKNRRKIAFYNMLPNEIIFMGTKIHTLKNQFDYICLSEAEAQAVVNNMYDTVRNGLLYIADRQFVEENDLEEVYADLISNEKLKDLLNHDATYVVEIYKSANGGQKNIIVDMLIDKKLKGVAVDANILMEIGNLSGKDLLHIEPLSE